MSGASQHSTKHNYLFTFGLYSIAIIGLVFLSISHGYAQANFWEPTVGPEGGDIAGIAVTSGGTLFADVGLCGIYRSTDKGESWMQSLAHPVFSTPSDQRTVTCDRNGIIFVRINNSMMRSSNNGVSWNPVGPASSVASVVVSDDGTVFALQSGGIDSARGVFYSRDSGTSWTPMKIGSVEKGGEVITVNHKGYIFISVPYGVERSTDLGETWMRITESRRIAFLTEDIMYHRTREGMTFISNDYGETWNQSKVILPELGNTYMVDGNIYSIGSAFRCSKDSGKSFITVDLGIKGVYVWDLCVTAEKGFFIATSRGVMRSRDGGKSWQFVNHGIAGFEGSPVVTGKKDIMFRTAVYPNESGRKTLRKHAYYRSVDDGKTWESNDVDTAVSPRYFYGDKQGVLYASTLEATGRSRNNGASWDFVKSIFNLTDFKVSPQGKIFAYTYRGLEMPPSEVYLRDRFGGIWEKINLPAWEDGGIAFADNGNIYVSGGGVFLSEDHGNTNRQVFGKGLTAARWPLTGPIIIDEHGNIVVAVNLAQDRVDLYRSTDEGKHWAPWNALDVKKVWQIVQDKKHNMYVATSNGVYRYNESGNKWDGLSSGLTDLSIRRISFTPQGHLLAQTWGNGIFRSVKPVE